jgi:hypothetical protein
VRRDDRIRRLVTRVRRQTGRAVPHVDPDGPGDAARVLILLQDPGELGALRTGYLSPTKNNDATALNQKRLMRDAGLREEVCLFWNAVPWDLKGQNPTAADKRSGATYLAELIGLLRHLRAIVACGTIAHEVCDLAEVEALRVCHPSDRGLSGHIRGARPRREADYRRRLAEAAALAKERGTRVASPGRSSPRPGRSRR